jgi:tetratricopeptide (TPR) repeat protein
VDALEYIRLLLQVSPQFDIVAEFSQALSKHSNNVSASAVSESNPFHDALLQASQDLGSLYERVASWLTHIAGCSAGLAVPLLLRASEIRIADQSSSVRHVAHTNHMIAQLYSAQNEHSNALPFAETAITLFLPVLPSSIQASVTLPTKLVKSGSTHFNIAEGGEKESIKFFCTLLLSYAQCLAAMSSLSVSISMFEQVLSLQMSHKFDDLTLAATRNNMADVLMSSESYDQALQHYEFSARVYQAERGSDSIELANILSSQASALLQLGADLNCTFVPRLLLLCCCFEI